MNSEELKNCPFCGGNARMTKRKLRLFGKNCFGAKKFRIGVQYICNTCKARGPLVTETIITDTYESEGIKVLEIRAKTLWNDRTIWM